MTKAHKRKMHAAAWSPAARAKRAATLAARKAAIKEVDWASAKKTGKGSRPRRAVQAAAAVTVDMIRDVTVFLEHGEKAMLEAIAGSGGRRRITKSETFLMLALTTLRGN